ncbi:unnamed protein product, partial [marine sediment metagenome]
DNIDGFSFLPVFSKTSYKNLGHEPTKSPDSNNRTNKNLRARKKADK